MKWTGRLFVFALAMFVGLAAAFFPELLRIATLPGVPGPIESVIPARFMGYEPAVSANGVSVTYAGLRRDEGGEPQLRMLVHNGLSEPLHYSAHYPTGPWPAFRVNGGPVEKLFGCGTDIEHYQIAPGQTAEFHVSPYGLPITPKADDKVAIGFHIGPISGEGRSPVFSEPFTLPEEFINQKRERELLLLNQQ